MSPKITIAYVTGRLNPQWQWFCDSLCAQTTAEERDAMQILVIDGHAQDDMAWDKSEKETHLGYGAVHPCRLNALEDCVQARFDYQHLPPLPCAWQGPFRQTKRDWFCAGNTRNTAFVVAQHPYVVFVDDLSVLMPGWFDQVRHAAQDQYVVCGAYKKVKNLTVLDDPFAVTYEEFPPGVDSRWSKGSDTGVVPWHGSAMFGCSFGVPLEAALEVDGNDGACNGAGAEDYDFGIRLERAGWPFFYNRNMLTLESEEHHHVESSLPREAKLVMPEYLPKGYTGNPMSDHVMLNRVCQETERILPIIGHGLREMRQHYLATGLVPVPAPDQRDWRDGKLLSEIE